MGGGEDTKLKFEDPLSLGNMNMQLLFFGMQGTQRLDVLQSRRQWLVHRLSHLPDAGFSVLPTGDGHLEQKHSSKAVGHDDSMCLKTNYCACLTHILLYNNL